MTKYKIRYSNAFKKSLKKVLRQGRDVDKLIYIVKKIANKEELEPKYHNHDLENSKYYKNCNECHIEPDWLLIYQYIENELILLLLDTGSHSNLF